MQEASWNFTNRSRWRESVSREKGSGGRGKKANPSAPKLGGVSELRSLYDIERRMEYCIASYCSSVSGKAQYKDILMYLLSIQTQFWATWKAYRLITSSAASFKAFISVMDKRTMEPYQRLTQLVQYTTRWSHVHSAPQNLGRRIHHTQNLLRRGLWAQNCAHSDPPLLSQLSNLFNNHLPSHAPIQHSPKCLPHPRNTLRHATLLLHRLLSPDPFRYSPHPCQRVEVHHFEARRVTIHISSFVTFGLLDMMCVIGKGLRGRRINTDLWCKGYSCWETERSRSFLRRRDSWLRSGWLEIQRSWSVAQLALPCSDRGDGHIYWMMWS